MQWELPKAVEIDGKKCKIRNACDYRVVLDVISALNDKELNEQYRVQCALFIFYEDLSGITNIEAALSEMLKIINCGEDDEKNNAPPKKLMDWEHDFKNIAAPVSRVLGYSVRDSKNYTHWYDFIGAYGEIGDCYFAQVINIRKMRQEGKALNEADRKFYREHKKDIDLPTEMTDEEKDWLEYDW